MSRSAPAARTRGLAFRLSLVGLVQLLLVAVAALVIGAVVTRLPERMDMQRLTETVARAALAPAALTATLSEIGKHESVSLTLYDQDRKLVASNVEPPLSVPRWRDGLEGPPPPWEAPPGAVPPPPDQVGGPPPPDGPPFGGAGFGVLDLFGRHPEPTHRPPVYQPLEIDGHAYLLAARFERRTPSRMPALLTLVAGLFVVGAGALLTARWIGRPLDRLSRAARALGEGNLRARTGMDGHDVLGDVGQAFDEMAERVQALLVAEKELLANVSHELRTPLARIRVALDLAVEGDAAAAQAAIADIGVDLAELEALVDDVLDAARLEIADPGDTNSVAHPGFALRLEETDPARIAGAAADRFRSHHPHRPFETSFDAPLPSVQADAVLLRRVIDNLLENADKYSPDPTGVIRLQLRARDGGVAFDVVDAGMGIAAADLPRVFAPFFRAERSRSRGTGGVGLGLTLAKRITMAHGGAIDVKSVEGAGTTVTVLLPTPAP
jgi:two-component system OmpR family sensor kinase